MAASSSSAGRLENESSRSSTDSYSESYSLVLVGVSLSKHTFLSLSHTHTGSVSSSRAKGQFRFLLRPAEWARVWKFGRFRELLGFFMGAGGGKREIEKMHSVTPHPLHRTARPSNCQRIVLQDKNSVSPPEVLSEILRRYSAQLRLSLHVF